jgi:hypothetical protein
MSQADSEFIDITEGHFDQKNILVSPFGKRNRE